MKKLTIKISEFDKARINVLTNNGSTSIDDLIKNLLWSEINRQFLDEKVKRELRKMWGLNEDN